MHDVDRLAVQKWLESAHHLQLLAGSKGTRVELRSASQPSRTPDSRVLNEQRIHRLGGLGHGDRAGRIQFVMAMHRDVDLVAQRLAALL